MLVIEHLQVALDFHSMFVHTMEVKSNKQLFGYKLSSKYLICVKKNIKINKTHAYNSYSALVVMAISINLNKLLNTSSHLNNLRGNATHISMITAVTLINELHINNTENSCELFITSLPIS